MPHYLSDEELKQTAPAEVASFRSPVPTQIVSNGEFNPLPQTREQQRVEARIKELADDLGRRHGMDRRQFLASSAGMAAAFLAMNDVFGPIFVVSDTKVALLSGAPFDDQTWDLLSNDQIAMARAAINKIADSRRLLGHAVFTPKRQGWMNEVDRAISTLKPDSWKGYTIGDPLFPSKIGTAFANSAVANPRFAAAFIGTLVRGLGADHVVWGSDSVWYGSPQWQIEALRRLEIPEDMQKTHGFAPLGPADGIVKTAIFGGNSARLYKLDVRSAQGEITRDKIAAIKAEYVA